MKIIQKKLINVTLSIFIILYLLMPYQTIFASSINTDELGNFLNQERKARNLSILDWDSKLYNACQEKANHMITNNYFEHYAPDGTSPWNFITNSQYDYKFAGENLAMDFSTSKATHDAWMASLTHKENMLNPEYEDYAIYVTQGKIGDDETTLVVEMFGTKDNPVFAKTNKFVASILNYLLGKTQQIK